MTRSNRKKGFPFFLWHRRLGLLALLFMVALAVTGIMLNHTESLKMNTVSVESDLLLNWYGLNPKGKPTGYKTGNNFVSQWDHQLFFNSMALINNKSALLGAVTASDSVALALDKSILLLNTEGEIIEHIDMSFKFEPIKKIGLINQSVAIQTQDNKVYIADKDILNWQSTSSTEINWSSPIELSRLQQQSLKKTFRGNGLSLERVILDLHSGRLFSANWGIYIMDASAVMIILLSLSGFWIWWSKAQKLKTKKHYQKHHK